MIYFLDFLTFFPNANSLFKLCNSITFFISLTDKSLENLSSIDANNRSYNALVAYYNILNPSSKATYQNTFIP